MSENSMNRGRPCLNRGCRNLLPVISDGKLRASVSVHRQAPDFCCGCGRKLDGQRVWGEHGYYRCTCNHILARYAGETTHLSYYLRTALDEQLKTE
jgi:hypothetical protein